LDRLPRPQARPLASHSDSSRGLRRIRSWSDWRSSAYCPRRPRSGRSWLLLMTRIGWTMPRRGRLRSSLAACWRRRSRSCSPRARSTTRSGAYRRFTLGPCGIVMHGRCWCPSCRRGSMSPCWRGSFSRPVGIRLRCWSCRGG
jgi:hypothetical protein